MRLFNTLTNKKEEFKPIEEGKVSIYICGPTVYNHAHIGNTRPMIVFDVLRRTFEYLGNDVTFVSNYTDVDDKIIKAAKAEGITDKELTDKYIKAYEDVRAGLNIEDPTYKPRVTETMPEIIDFIQALIDKGYAYEVDGDVYFRVTKVKEYGMLSGVKVEDLIAGASDRTLSVDDKKKESTTDFALWKKTNEGIQFDTPWSKGRPGWHTECVVMIQDVFKKTLIDIHGGGLDLKFPHHENEIAQCEVCNDTHLANIWVHNGMININGIKMSKSLGNVWWAKDLIANHGGNLTRWLMISTHYRAPLNLNEEAFSTSKKELDKIAAAYKQACVKLALSNAKETTAFDETYTSFIDALNDDLNTPNAISVVYEVVKKINQAVRQREIDVENLAVLVHTLEKMLYILGIEFDKITMSDEDKEMYQNWRSAVKEKDFETADTLRAALIEKGIL